MYRIFLAFGFEPAHSGSAGIEERASGRGRRRVARTEDGRAKGRLVGWGGLRGRARKASRGCTFQEWKGEPRQEKDDNPRCFCTDLDCNNSDLLKSSSA